MAIGRSLLPAKKLAPLQLIQILFQSVFMWLFLGATLSLVAHVPSATISQVLKWGCVRATLPIMIFVTVVKNICLTPLWSMMPYAVAGFIFPLSAYGLSRLAHGGFRLQQHAPTFHLGNSFNNYGFLAYGLVAQLLGQDKMPLLFVFVMISELFLWTWGLQLLQSGKASPAKAILSPPALANILGIIVGKYMTMPLNENILLSGLETIGKTAVPLALTCLGALLMNTAKHLHWKKDLLSLDLWVSMALRHLVYPILAIAFLVTFVQDTNLKNILLIEAIMPMALMTMTIASIYKGDHQKIGLAICTSMLICTITIPAWLYILIKFNGFCLG